MLSFSSRATLIGLAAPLMWASFPMLTALMGHFPPFQFMAIQLGLAGIMTLGMTRIRRLSLGQLLKAPKGYWALGVYGIFGFYSLHFSAYQHAPAAQAYILVSLWPMLMLVFSFLFFRQMPKHWHIAGVLMGFAGVVTISYTKGFEGFLAEYWLGHVLAASCALVWASYSVLNHAYKNVPVEAMFGVQFAAAFLALIAHFMFEPTESFTLRQSILLLVMAIGPTGLGLLAWSHGTKHGDLRVLSTFSYLSPIIAALLLWTFGIPH